MTRKCMQGATEITEQNEFCTGGDQQTVQCNKQSCRKSLSEVTYSLG